MALMLNQEQYGQVDQNLAHIDDYLDAVAEEIQTITAIGARRRTWGWVQAQQAKERIRALRDALAEEQSW
jgi:hypothetical protein